MKLNKTLNSILFALYALCVVCSCGNSAHDAVGSTEVVIETDRGSIVLRLYDDTPEYRDNFVALIDQGAYDGTVWHRLVPGGFIQAGTNDERRFVGETLPSRILYPQHFHKRGALAAARENDDVNPEKRSSNTQFYIVTGKVFSPGQLAEEHQMMQDCDTVNVIPPFTPLQKKLYTTIGGAPYLDGRYTVFGEVVEGMNVVEYYGRQKAVDEKPVKQLKIRTIKVTKR